MNGTDNSAKISPNELFHAWFLSTSQNHRDSIGLAKPVMDGSILSEHCGEHSLEMASYIDFRCASD